jgi:hypothetical protein
MASQNEVSICISSAPRDARNTSRSGCSSAKKTRALKADVICNPCNRDASAGRVPKLAFRLGLLSKDQAANAKQADAANAVIPKSEITSLEKVWELLF